MQRHKRKRASTASTAGEDDEADVKMYSPDIARTGASSRTQGRRVRSAQAAFPWSVGYDEKMRSWIAYGTTPEEKDYSVLPTDVQRIIASQLHPCDLVPDLDCNQSTLYRDPFGTDPLQRIDCSKYCRDMCRRNVQSIIINAPKFVVLSPDNMQFQIMAIHFVWTTIGKTSAPTSRRQLTVDYAPGIPDLIYFQTAGWGRPASVVRNVVPGKLLSDDTTAASVDEAVAFLCDVTTEPQSPKVSFDFRANPNIPINARRFTLSAADSFYDNLKSFHVYPFERNLFRLITM